MRNLTAWLLCAQLLLANTSIDEKIANTSKRLDTFESTYSQVNTDMANNAREILSQNRAILKQQQELEKLRSDIEAKKTTYQEQKEELGVLQGSSYNFV